MVQLRQTLSLTVAAALLTLAAPRPARAQQPTPQAPAAAAQGASQQAPANGPRIAYVNTDAILQQMTGYAQAESTLTAEVQGYTSEVQTLQSQLDSAQSAYDQAQIALSPSARQSKLQEIQQMQQRFQQRYKELNDKVASRRQELVQPFEDRLKQILEGLRAERNLAMIFDVAAPGNNVVAADRSLDLTPVVIQRVKASN